MTTGFLVLVLGLTVYAAQQPQILTREAANNDTDLVFKNKGTNSVDVKTKGRFWPYIMVIGRNNEIIAVDLVIEFDTSMLELTDIMPQSTENYLHVPINNQDQFKKWNTMNEANSNGVIRMSAVAYDFAGEKIKNPAAVYNFGISQFGFKAKDKEGSTTIRIKHTPGSKIDSNVLVKGVYTDRLTNVTNLSVTIHK